MNKKADNLIGTKKEFDTCDLNIIRTPNNTFKTAITYKGETVLFMARKFTKEYSEVYEKDGCVVKAFILKGYEIPDVIKWTDEPDFESHKCGGSNTNEVIALISTAIEYTGHKFSTDKVNCDPLYICDSITINMKRALKAYKG